MVWIYIYIYQQWSLKMSCMATKCLHGNYLVVTIKYIKTHKCVYKNYFYHSSVIFSPLSLCYWVFWRILHKHAPISVRIKSHTGRRDVVRVNQEVNHVWQLTKWFGVGCGTKIHDRSTGQLNQLHTSRVRSNSNITYGVGIYLYNS